MKFKADTLHMLIQLISQQLHSGGPSFVKMAIVGGIGWLAGAKVHSNKAAKLLKKKHMKEKEHSLRLEQYKRQEFERKQRLKNEALIEFQKMQWNSVELKKKNKYSYFNKDSVAFFNNLRHKLPFQIRKSGFK